MKYFTTTSKASRRAVDCVIVGVYTHSRLGVGAEDVDAASKGEITKRIKSGDVSASIGHCEILTNVPGIKADRVAVVGLGKSGKLTATGFKKAVTAAAQAITRTKAKS